MGNPIQSIRITYDYAKKARDNGNVLSNEDIVKMLNTLGVPQEEIEKYPRYQKGYAAEDLFMRIYSLLPWIKNIVPLGQEQFPEQSKEITQVSDYLVTYEVGNSSTTSTILLEAKLVDGNKSTFKLQNYKYDVLKKYSIDNNIPLLFALFWREKGIWTINTISVFKQLSSEYKITYSEAVENDLSAIFGDYVYVFDKSFYRKSVFNNASSVESTYFSSHEELGRTILEETSVDGVSYKRLDHLFSPVIDCIFDMREVSRKNLTLTESEIVEYYQPSDKNIAAIKLSTLMYSYLVKLWQINKDDLYFFDSDFINQTFDIVDTARRIIGGERYYLLPNTNNQIHEDLMVSQFGAVRHIIDAYHFMERKEECIICSAHNEDLPNILLKIKTK